MSASQPPPTTRAGHRQANRQAMTLPATTVAPVASRAPSGRASASRPWRPGETGRRQQIAGDGLGRRAGSPTKNMPAGGHQHEEGRALDRSRSKVSRGDERRGVLQEDGVGGGGELVGQQKIMVMA
jgi:hypothetical protein